MDFWFLEALEDGQATLRIGLVNRLVEGDSRLRLRMKTLNGGTASSIVTLNLLRPASRGALRPFI
jgi:hypothetical protein